MTFARKAILVAFLALQFSGAVGLALNPVPWPDCLPCKVVLQ